jgi:hypothetical protein
MPYPKDDDWGDWAYEARKDKEASKAYRRVFKDADCQRIYDVEMARLNEVAGHLALHHDLAHRDFDAELARAFATTYSDCSDTCQRCGRKDRGTGCDCSVEVLP